MYIYLKPNIQEFAVGTDTKLISESELPNIRLLMQDMKAQGSSSAHLPHVAQGVIVNLRDDDADDYADVALAVVDVSAEVLQEAQDLIDELL